MTTELFLLMDHQVALEMVLVMAVAVLTEHIALMGHVVHLVVLEATEHAIHTLLRVLTDAMEAIQVLVLTVNMDKVVLIVDMEIQICINLRITSPGIIAVIMDQVKCNIKIQQILVTTSVLLTKDTAVTTVAAILHQTVV